MRLRHSNALAAVLLACLAGVAVAQPQASDRAGDLEREYLAPLRAKSCPPSVTRMQGETIALTVSAVPLQGMNPSRKAIGDLTFVAGFHLVSTDKRFGGLSDVDLLDDGRLLAITDQGDFVWLDLADDGVTPTRARIAPLQNAAGEPLRGKQEGDAEDLAYNDGLALVSFERDHRVLAFDIAGCSAAARGAPVTFGGYGGDFAAAFDSQNLKVDGNSGCRRSRNHAGLVFCSPDSKLRQKVQALCRLAPLRLRLNSTRLSGRARLPSSGSTSFQTATLSASSACTAPPNRWRPV